MTGWQFQCIQTTCLPFSTKIVPNIIICQTTCLIDINCQAVSFHPSSSICEIFVNIPNPAGNMLSDMDTITMITIVGMRNPFELTTSSTTTSSSSSSSSSTTSSSTSSSTTTTTTTSTSTTTTATEQPITLLLQPDDNVVGLYNTTAGKTTSNFNGIYSNSNEDPRAAIDRNLTTKYLNFGITGCSGCSVNGPGIGTGFFVTPSISNATVAIGIIFATGNDDPERDPLTITLEGSNAMTNTTLHLATSWTLIYNGSTGIDSTINNTRSAYAIQQNFNNTRIFASYRLLITSQRSIASSVQYAEVQILGKSITTNERSIVFITRPNDTITSLYNTTTGKSTSGFNGIYPASNEGPCNAIDRNLATKYSNYGGTGGPARTVNGPDALYGIPMITVPFNPMNDNIEQDLPNTNSASGYVRLPTSTTQLVLSSLSCPIPITKAEWNRESTIFVNPLARCVSTENGLCKAQDLFIDNIHDNLYVVDTDNNRIQKYSLIEPYDPQQGAVGLTVASKGLIEPQSIFVDSQTEDIEVGEYGFGKNHAAYLTLDKEMNIYVGTRFYIRKWLSSSNYTQRIMIAGKNDQGGNGTSDLYDSYAFYIDNDLTLYIADWENHRIQKWLFNASEGVTLVHNLTYIYGLTMGCNGHLYYTDTREQSISQLNLKTNEKTIIIGNENRLKNKKLFFPSAMKFDKFGNIFVIVIDSTATQIRKFSIIRN
ncbi:hypothetical protein I4U23_016909 [Adineta vaga]|nr:hypothetical protein I4U23_016909 [Adineta vaga]